MSWIAGIFRFDGATVTADQLAPMLDELATRPHDARASWCGGPAGLACLPLRVTAEDAFDAQPLQHADSDTRIVFDGRLDNRPTLIERLGLNAAEAHDQPDSYFALQAWLKWGADCCDHLQGDYAFAVWDARARKLALFRDHIGLRPLYYSHTDAYFAFASHSAALRALPGVDSGLDEDWVVDYLCFTHYRRELTAYRGIRKLPAAHRLILRPGNTVEPECYWRLSDERREIGRRQERDYYEEFLHLLQTAVTERLRGHGPAASMFSGGLDSSALTAIASEKLVAEGRPLVAVSSVLARDHVGEETDEQAFIQAMLNRYPSIDWRPVSASGQTVFSEFDALLNAYDQPSRDLFYFMTLALMREASDAGSRIMMTGFGGDCYASAKLNEALLDMFLHGRVLRALRICRQEAAAMGITQAQAARAAFPRQLKVKLRRCRHSGKDLDTTGTTLSPALNAGFCERTQARTHLARFQNQTTAGFFRTMLDEEIMLTSGVLEEGMSSQVVMGKTLGLDVVMPLLDKELISYSVNLPLYIRRNGGLQRSLLRNATRHLLPDVVAQRTCKGAFIPDMTRRNYAATAAILPCYESGEKELPDFLELQPIRDEAREMRKSGSGFDQSANPLVNVIAPLVVAEFYARRSGVK